MIRIVPDSNMLVSGFPNSTGAPSTVVTLWRDRQIQFIVSEHILNEVAEAWTSPYWLARFKSSQVDRALRLLRKRALVVDLVIEVSGDATHAQDDPVIATALNGKADYLVTGDKGLRGLGAFQGVEIRTPQEFLEEFAALS